MTLPPNSLCEGCGEYISDCECGEYVDCLACEGRGEVLSFEDRWNYAAESHYTVDTVEDCDECNGIGKKRKEDGK